LEITLSFIHVSAHTIPAGVLFLNA